MKQLLSFRGKKKKASAVFENFLGNNKGGLGTAFGILEIAKMRCCTECYLQH